MAQQEYKWSKWDVEFSFTDLSLKCCATLLHTLKPVIWKTDYISPKTWSRHLNITKGSMFQHKWNTSSFAVSILKEPQLWSQCDCLRMELPCCSFPHWAIRKWTLEPEVAGGGMYSRPVWKSIRSSDLQRYWQGHFNHHNRIPFLFQKKARNFFL